MKRDANKNSGAARSIFRLFAKKTRGDLNAPSPAQRGLILRRTLHTRHVYVFACVTESVSARPVCKLKPKAVLAAKNRTVKGC